MKKRVTKNAGESPRLERILVFDLIRILCVAVIVYDHARFELIPGINQLLFPDGYGLFGIYTSGLQGYAVYGMILVSGAVLEYNYRGIEKLTGYVQFLFRRFIRIYPAFWMSLAFSFILFPALWLNHLSGVVFEFTGFFVVLGQGPGILNPMGWFIAAIFSLYILFPWLSKITRNYGLYALLGFCLVSWGLRSLLITYSHGPGDLFWRWFPLCNAFEFCLGIYIVQAGWYPKKMNNYPLIQTLSDLSYYVFLLHIPVVLVFSTYLNVPLQLFYLTLSFNNPAIGFTLYYLQILLAVLGVSWIAMKIDGRLRSEILRHHAVKKFLKPERSG